MTLTGNVGVYMESSSEAGFLDKLGIERIYVASGENKVNGYPELTQICKVAGLGGTPYRSGDYDYYIHETVCSGDTKGTAPFLMSLACVGA